MSEDQRTTEQEPAQQAAADQAAAEELNPVVVIKESLTELLTMAEPAREFTSQGGRRYVLTGLNGWTGRQNKTARQLYRRIEKGLKQRRADGEKVSVMAVLDILLEEDLWEEFFATMYIPEGAEAYNAERAAEYRDDMLDMTNEQAIGALAFFITSSLSFIPRGILTYFRSMPMIAAILEVLDERQKHGAGSATATASST